MEWSPSALRGLSPHRRTIPALLDLQAEAFSARTLVRTDAGERSFAGARDAAAGYASRLAEAGIRCGDRVAVLSENRLEYVDLWLASAWLGAVLVPINTALRGGQLEHVLRDSGARLLVVEDNLVPVLEFVEKPLPALQRIWVIGEHSSASWRRLPCERFPDPGDAVPARATRPGDLCMILYTSGTTGPPKGVLCPHGQWYWWGILTGEVLGVKQGDVLYTRLPLFHTNALNTLMQALTGGATFVPGPRFSASAFWRPLAESGATVTYLLGAMVHILAKRPPDPHERAHGVRVALSPATPPALHEPFFERFGIRLIDGWGSTETNVVLSTAWAGAPPGSMGKATPGFSARVVDGEDEEVSPGIPGELVVRSDEAFAFASGYHGLPEKTVEAWRNLWFHTGDRVVRDADGWFWFLDRLKDSIRRRGENISSYEVEAVLSAHPDVAAAAVVPVPSEVGEDEVLACVVVREGASLPAEELIRFCEPRLAYFAIPRYVEFLDELPLTPNGKIEKYRLRERGVTEATWDRERAGYTLNRTLPRAP
jgi:crotonobetaine/carnitine-CoA ligase